MLDLSVRMAAEDCPGLTEDAQLVRDVFGFTFGSPNRMLSVRSQLELATGEALEINVILATGEVFRRQPGRSARRRHGGRTSATAEPDERHAAVSANHVYTMRSTCRHQIRGLWCLFHLQQ